MSSISNEPISQEEVLRMFGEYMPMTAAKLLSEASPYQTVGELRAELRKMAQAWRPEREEKAMTMTTDRFEILARRIHKRTTSPEGFNHRLDAWSMSEWMVAMFGEFGEAANIVKKLNRDRDGFQSFNKGATKDDLMEQLGDELGDGLSYLILFCYAAGIDLLAVTEKKFDKVSKEKGYVESFRPFGE